MSKHDHDAGLAHDLAVWNSRLGRRRLLAWLTYGGLAACGSSASQRDNAAAATNSDGSTTDQALGGGDGSCAGTIPEETPGPYPGDGTNGANALTLDGIVRSDIRTSVAGASGVATGVPLTLRLIVVDQSCQPLAGYAVYVWHCDQAGRYSMYSQGAQNENYLRGVQESADDGSVEFTTIFPACYPGRWPHIHFEIYSALAAAKSGRNAVATSQLALPKSDCDAVFATAGYEASVNNLAAISLTSDLVFSDGVSLQLPAISGDPQSGYSATLQVTITP
ncbi:MAG TPA: intradiol ring-cleavage dioxygenase [Polyangiaceae bacterium]|nr:intradiol ring-cleavage dioxygenase [Polyangiaceae bacterium]